MATAFDYLGAYARWGSDWDEPCKPGMEDRITGQLLSSQSWPMRSTRKSFKSISFCTS